MRTALRNLIEFGGDALKARKVDDKKWQKPLISKRVAGVLRKQALKEGTFGSFDSESGIGWDRKWDPVGQVGTITFKPPKGTIMQRTREGRALKIDLKMEGMDGKIDEHIKKLNDKKPKEFTFDVRYKRVIRLARKK